MNRFIKIILSILLLLYPFKIFASQATLKINAEAAILMDAKTGTILYEKNAYKRYYPASITKLMTAYLAIKNLNPNDYITFSNHAVTSIDSQSSRIGMRVGEQLLVDQALHALLLDSANDVANALGEAVSGTTENFAQLMTKTAHDFGATSTNFANPHGLHNSHHYTTPYDMALITKAIYNNEYLREIMETPTYQIPSTNLSNKTIYLSQSHALMNPIRDSQRYRSDVILGKTGYTTPAGNTLVTVGKRDEVELIVVIMKGQLQNYYNDTNALLDYGFKSYTALNLNSPNEVITVAPLYSIQSGKLFEVANCEISTRDKITVVVRSNIYKKDLEVLMDLEENLRLGAKEGEVVGTITYMHNGKNLASSDLIISKINFKPATSLYNEPSVVKQSSIFNSDFFVVAIAGITLLFILTRQKKRNKSRF
ncbi:MAG: hypothetical protein ATN31_06830 [Candidatus Epulonipiscioides saccharophilum]|nr:MAG: hypothetical protein ATN31_06830 [Epulopiscium sp. AS2M-Bin001]